MPQPLNDRERWRQEFDELPQQIAKLQAELDSLPLSDRSVREMRTWQIDRMRRRRETLAKWLARADTEST